MGIAAGAIGRVAVTGATGLVGSELCPLLSSGGSQVLPLVRRPPQRTGDVFWDPDRGEIDAGALEGLDAVIHLAGESVAGGRWTKARRARILRSRIDGTRVLCEALLRLRRPPRVLVCASAVGFYGSRGDELLTEESVPGKGFLPDVALAWEAAATQARRGGIRVVHLRIGIVLTPRGGMLGRLLPLFALGLGGRAGSGRQWISWISLDDLLGVIQRVAFDDTFAGAVNATAPRPVTNAEFARTLGRVLRRPAILPAPAFAIRAALGAMGQHLMLEGNRVLPARLQERGFAFAHSELEGALQHMLGRTG